MGLDQAKSSLTVPLRLHDKVIGIFNIESRQRAAFNEDDRQFAEIFGRYVAIALNILDLMVVERVSTAHKVADDVCAEVAGPLNDIALGCRRADGRLHRPRRPAAASCSRSWTTSTTIRKSLQPGGRGAEHAILGADDVKGEDDPILERRADPGRRRRAEHPHDDQRRAAQVSRERHDRASNGGEAIAQHRAAATST